MTSDNLKCYLDTSIISAHIRKDIPDTWELQAVTRIISFWEQGKINCYTSEDVKEELDNIPLEYAEQRRRAKIIWQFLEKSTNFIEAESLNTWGHINWGETGGKENFWIDPLYKKITSIFPGRKDQRHIFLTIKNNIPYFVTYDKKTILKKAQAHEKTIEEWGLKILTPKQFDNSL